MFVQNAKHWMKNTWVWRAEDFPLLDPSSTVITSQWQLPLMPPMGLRRDIFKSADFSVPNSVSINKSCIKKFMVRASDMVERRDIWVLGGNVMHHRPWCDVQGKVAGKPGWVPINKSYESQIFSVRTTMQEEEKEHLLNVSAMVAVCDFCGSQNPYTLLCPCQGIPLLEAPQMPLFLEGPQACPEIEVDHLVSLEELL